MRLERRDRSVWRRARPQWAGGPASQPRRKASLCRGLGRRKYRRVYDRRRRRADADHGRSRRCRLHPERPGTRTVVLTAARWHRDISRPWALTVRRCTRRRPPGTLSSQARDAATGRLSAIPGVQGCVVSAAADGCTVSGDLSGYSFDVIATGSQIYVASMGASRVVTFDRQPSGGARSPRRCCGLSDQWPRRRMHHGPGARFGDRNRAQRRWRRRVRRRSWSKHGRRGTRSCGRRHADADGGHAWLRRDRCPLRMRRGRRDVRFGTRRRGVA